MIVYTFGKYYYVHKIFIHSTNNAYLAFAFEDPWLLLTGPQQCIASRVENSPAIPNGKF